MTFGIVLANADQIILATDRRLTWGSRLIDDSATKAGRAVCDDVSFLYCFTGQARVGKDYITSRWLLEALTTAGRRSHKYRDVMDGLADETTRFFRSAPFLRALPAASRRLTIMLPGYTADGFIVNSLSLTIRTSQTSSITAKRWATSPLLRNTPFARQSRIRRSFRLLGVLMRLTPRMNYNCAKCWNAVSRQRLYGKRLSHSSRRYQTDQPPAGRWARKLPQLDSTIWLPWRHSSAMSPTKPKLRSISWIW
jgi:hypothetical protein